MPLLGQGVAAIWHNADPAVEEDYSHWHTSEHVPERVAIPGFLRGRRYVAVEGWPRYFHFYETKDLATLTSPAYLARLNDPTPWTRRIGPHIRDNNRTLARVAASHGFGCGAAILTIRLSFDPGGGAGPGERWLADTLLPSLPGRHGLTGAHLLRGDAEAAGVPSAEKAMRATRDEAADRVVMVEATVPAALHALRRDELSDAALADRGAAAIKAGIYTLEYALASTDLRQPR